MKVISEGIVNNEYLDKYGKRGSDFNQHGMPTYSIPFTISDEPKATKSFAFVLEDKDAYPVTGGFSWIHWLGANLTRNSLSDNESQSAADFVQGANSWTSVQGGNQSAKDSSYYGGMAPSNAPHLYELHIYALDCKLDIENGFLYNELHHLMDGHILEQCVLKGTYHHGDSKN